MVVSLLNFNGFMVPSHYRCRYSDWPLYYSCNCSYKRIINLAILTSLGQEMFTPPLNRIPGKKLTQFPPESCDLLNPLILTTP